MNKGYDKRVYENTWFSWVQILSAFLGLYVFVGLLEWAIFEYGITYSSEYTLLSCLLFLTTIIFMAGIIISGYFANRTKLFSDYLNEKLSEKKAKREEELIRVKQE